MKFSIIFAQLTDIGCKRNVAYLPLTPTFAMGRDKRMRKLILVGITNPSINVIESCERNVSHHSTVAIITIENFKIDLFSPDVTKILYHYGPHKN